MRRAFTVLFILIITTLLFGGCTRTLSEEPKVQNPKPDAPSPITSKKPSDFFPLTKGSTWQYHGEGNEYASFNLEVIFTKDDRAQIREDNGGTVISKVFKTTENEIVLTFFQGESYDESNFLDQESNENLTLLKAPLEVGTKWEHPTGTREIADVKTTVDTLAGKFEDCIVVKITSQNSTVFEYFKDGVGMVKREFLSEGSQVTSVLEKFNINP